MNNQILGELELLTRKIETNTATIEDYKRYEVLLLNGGLTHEYIFSYLNQAGFKNWEDFIKTRQKKQTDKDNEAALIGGLVGLGLGLLLLGILSKSSNK